MTTPACSGTAKPCSTYDGLGTCSQQQGCSLSMTGTIAGRCNQYYDSCNDGENNPTKCAALECSYDAGDCYGAITYCPPLKTSGECMVKAACSWQPADKHYCNGIAKGCASFSSKTCTSQAGCTATTPACTGTPTTCAELSPEACKSQPGCLLNGTGGTGGGGSGGSGGSAAMPDLVMTVLNVSEGTSTGGPAVFVEMREINRGNAPAGPHTDALYVSSDTTLGNADDIKIRDVPTDFTLEPFGLSTSVWGPVYITKSSLEAQVPTGFYYLGMVADSGGVLTESEETNNMRMSTTRVFIGTPRYDIKVTNVSWDASSSAIQPGTAVTISATVQNAGNFAIPSYNIDAILSSDTTADASDPLICTKSFTTSLDIGGEAVVQLSCVTPRVRGTFHLGARASLTGVTDADLTNNAFVTADTFTFSAPSPDLVVTMVDTAATSKEWSGTETFYATVQNAGVDPAGATMLGFYMSANSTYDSDDTLVCQVSVAALAAGGSQQITKDCALPKTLWGAFRVIARADVSDLVFEADESNNTAVGTASYTILHPSWDLSADGLSDNAGATVTAGSTIHFTFGVTNHGANDIDSFTVDVVATTGTSVSSGDTVVCSVTVQPGTALTTWTIERNCVMPDLAPGIYRFGISVDPSDDVEESNESNNTYLSTTTHAKTY